MPSLIYEIAGQGTINGKPVNWSLTMIVAKKPVIAFATAEPGSWDKNESRVVKFLRGIKKLD